MEMDSAGPSTAQTRPQEQLLYLIYKFLRSGPCTESAEVLRREIEQCRLVPPRTAFDGTTRPQSLDEFDRRIGHLYSGRTLPDATTALVQLLDEKHPPSLPRLERSFLARSHQLVHRHRGKEWRKRDGLIQSSASFRLTPTRIPHRRPFRSTEHLLFSRESGGRVLKERFISSSFLRKFELHCRIVGHLASAFCLTYDRTGEFMITGSDDNLVKLWSSRTGTLRFTFRGCAAEITDIAVSPDNSLLAVGSVDKTLRVWDLQTGGTVGVLTGHTAMVTSVNFLSFSRDDDRFLVSTGNDCVICFWKWKASTKQFQSEPIKFCERSRPGAQMVCATMSPGGLLVGTGSSDNYVRVYQLLNGYPERILEVEAHGERVDSLQWAHRGLRFLSGSKEGFAKIWRFQRKEWRSITLNVADTKPNPHESSGSKTTKTKVTMVGWSADDRYAITAASDFLLRIWNSRDGTFLRFLSGHKDESFVLQSHPLSPSVLLSAGHDGCLILWDLDSGTEIKKHFNFIEGQGYGAFFDAQFSPDGASISAVDSHGNLSILGLNSDEKLARVPKEQFFHTDFRPLMRDNNGFVLDEQTQLAPHLMPPPFLVDASGAPHPASVQRLVPGREKLSHTFLSAEVVRRVDDETSLVDVTGVDSGSQSPSNPETRAENGREGESLPLCVWLNRPIVRAMAPEEVGRLCEAALALEGDEMEELKEEREKSPLRTPPPPLFDTMNHQERGLRTRRRPKIPAHEYQTRSNPKPTRTIGGGGDFVDPETVNMSGESSSGESSEESNSSETSDSEYSEPERATRSSKKTVPNGTTSTRRTRKASVAEDEAPSEEEEEEEEGEEGEAEPGTSQRQSRSPDLKIPRNPKRDVPRKVKPKIVVPVLGEEFPEWFTETEPKKSPYFPQVGDEIVYYPEGHDQYFDAVERENLYRVVPKMRPRENLGKEEFALVEQVKFTNSPYRLVCLKVLQLVKATSRPTDFRYQIRYHDMNGVVDFIVLRQHYQKAIAQHWQSGSRFQAVIDNKWWFGTIVKVISPQDPGNRSGHFQNITVRWETGEEEMMSPWDLEPFRSQSYPGKKEGAVEATGAELRALGALTSQPKDWSPAGKEQDCLRLIEGIEELEELSVSDPFKAPVDLSLYPDYSAHIPYPVDLHTITTRLRSGFYRRREAVETDVVQMAENAMSYNEDGAPIVKTSKLIRETIIRFIRNPEDERRISEIVKAFSSYPEAELDALETERRRKKPGRRNQDRKSMPTWMEECQRVMEDLVQDPNARPFVNPEDTELSDIFDPSVSLRSIQTRLQEGQYKTPQDYFDEVDSLFQNCRSMATNKRSTLYKSALALHSKFNETMNPIMEGYQRKIPGSSRQDRPRLRDRPGKDHLYNTRSTRRPHSPQNQVTSHHFDLTSHEVEMKPSCSKTLPRRSADPFSASSRPQRRTAIRQYSNEETNGRDERVGEKLKSGSVRNTRNRGKRTVVYDEDSSEGEGRRRAPPRGRGRSDSEEEERRRPASRRKPESTESTDEEDERRKPRSRRRGRSQSDEDEENGEGSGPVLSHSSRGRLRKLRRVYHPFTVQ